MGRPHQTRGDLSPYPPKTTAQACLALHRNAHDPALGRLPTRSSGFALQHKIRGETTAKRDTPHPSSPRLRGGNRGLALRRRSKVSRSRETTAVAAPPARPMVPPIGTTYHRARSASKSHGVVIPRSSAQPTRRPSCPSRPRTLRQAPLRRDLGPDAEGRMYCSMATADGSPASRTSPQSPSF